MATGGALNRLRQGWTTSAAPAWLLRLVAALALCAAACAPPPTGAPSGDVAPPAAAALAPVEALATATASVSPVPSPTATATATPIVSATATPPPAVSYSVTGVLAADAIEVTVGGRAETLRLIGVRAPQPPDLQRAGECYGREATAVAKALLEGKRVRIDGDVTQGGRDTTGRVPAYVWLPDNAFYNEVIIREGFAVEQTGAEPYRHQAFLQEAERDAREKGKGLWSPRTCGGLKPLPASAAPLKPQTSSEPKHAPAPKPELAPKPAANCDASYPGVCIPPPPPLLECRQLPFGKFKVFPPDPHQLDPDRNGIGCE